MSPSKRGKLVVSSPMRIARTRIACAGTPRIQVESGRSSASAGSALRRARRAPSECGRAARHAREHEGHHDQRVAQADPADFVGVHGPHHHVAHARARSASMPEQVVGISVARPQLCERQRSSARAAERRVAALRVAHFGTGDQAREPAQHVVADPARAAACAPRIGKRQPVALHVVGLAAQDRREHAR